MMVLIIKVICFMLTSKESTSQIKIVEPNP